MIVGIALCVLGVIFAYVWRANGKMILELQRGQQQIIEGVKGVSQIVREVHEGQVEIVRILQMMQDRLAGS